MKRDTKLIDDEDIIDPDNFAALREVCTSVDQEYEYRITLPNGKKYPIRFRKLGMALRMEAEHGHEGSKSLSFDNKQWVARQLRSLNSALIGVKFVDDIHVREPKFENHELPISWVNEEDFQILMEKIFRGFSIPAIAIQDKANAISDQTLPKVSGIGDAITSSKAL